MGCKLWAGCEHQSQVGQEVLEQEKEIQAASSILCYHSSGAGGTELLYARDTMAQPMRDLNKVLEQVRSGEFNPDATAVVISGVQVRSKRRSSRS